MFVFGLFIPLRFLRLFCELSWQLAHCQRKYFSNILKYIILTFYVTYVVAAVVTLIFYQNVICFLDAIRHTHSQTHTLALVRKTFLENLNIPIQSLNITKFNRMLWLPIPSLVSQLWKFLWQVNVGKRWIWRLICIHRHSRTHIRIDPFRDCHILLK